MTEDDHARRHDLAYRKLLGHALSVEEAAELDRLNDAFDKLLPPAPTLPEEVRELIAEAKRLLDK